MNTRHPHDRPANILVVDDSALQALILSRLLESEGYTTSVVADGKQALARVREESFDLIMTDLAMPNLNGVELCRAVRADDNLKDIRVILVTAFGSVADLLSAVSAGVDQYIVKPYTNSYLLARVKEELSLGKHKNPAKEASKLSINIGEKQYQVHAENEQLLKLLISTYEAAIDQNFELLETQLNHRSMTDKMDVQLQQLHQYSSDIKLTEERFRSISALIPDVIYRVDQSGRFTYLNQAIEQFGWSVQELIGEHFSTLLAEGELERVGREYALKQEQPTSNSIKLFDERRKSDRATRGLTLKIRSKLPAVEHKSAEFIAVASEVSSSGLYAEGSASPQFLGSIGIIHPIRDHEQEVTRLSGLNSDLEAKVAIRTRELAQANQALEEALNRLKLLSKDQELIVQEKTQSLKLAQQRAEEAIQSQQRFITRIGHEVRTPLNAILGGAFLLKEKVNDAQLHKTVQGMESAGKRLQVFFENVLALSRQNLESGLPLRTLDFSQMIHQTVQHIKQLHGLHGLSVSQEVNVAPFPSQQTHLIEKLLYNLLENAIKYTPKGEVNTRISFNDEGLSTDLLIEVIDTGCGVDEFRQATLFKPFGQLESDDQLLHAGAGLGLAVCSLIAEALGGSIGVESQLNQGSRFWVRLNPASVGLNATNSAVTTLTKARPRLLLVDDDGIFRQLIKGLFNQLPVRVETAATGLQAVKKIHDATEQYNLMLIDNLMPVMNGPEAIKIIRQTNADLPIIGLSATADDKTRDNFLKAGANLVLDKMMDSDRLVSTVLDYFPGIEAPKHSQAPVTQVDSELHDALSLLPGVDVGSALKLVSGSEAKLLDLLARFCKKHARRSDWFSEQLQNHQVDTLLLWAHSVKGLSRSLGLQGIADRAVTLESSLKNQASIEQLVKDSGLLLEDIKTLCSTVTKLQEHSQSSQTNQVEMTQESTRAFIEQLISKLKCSDAKAVSLFVERKASLEKYIDASLLAAIESDLTQYDFKAALEKVEQLPIRSES